MRQIPLAIAPEPLMTFETFVVGANGAALAHLRALGAQVETGRFRADMAVELVNDGPVTLLVEV